MTGERGRKLVLLAFFLLASHGADEADRRNDGCRDYEDEREAD
jgi:hypothetical protein